MLCRKHLYSLLLHKVQEDARKWCIVKGEIALMKSERNLLLVAVIVGCLCLLPIVGFVLASLWPQRVLVSWILLGLVVLVILVKLALWVIKIGTVAKVRLSEEELRAGRLYAHERLVEHEGRYNDEWTAQRQEMMIDEPYAAHPYVHSRHRQASAHYGTDNVPYGDLRPLGIDSFDWEEEK